MSVSLMHFKTLKCLLRRSEQFNVYNEVIFAFYHGEEFLKALVVCRSVVLLSSG